VKILMWSQSFYPAIGGIESLSRLLADEFVCRGHDVTLVTDTPSRGEDSFAFAIVRQPTWRKLLRLVMDCEVYLQNHISVRKIWPLLFIQRPWVVSHQTWIRHLGLRGQIRNRLLRHAISITCSSAIAASLRTPSTIVPNPYDDYTFRVMPDAHRDRDLIFVGRLIASKGAHLLIEAVNRLREENIEATVTITGLGPESESLIKQAEHLGLARQVEFTGPRSGRELAVLLNQHKIQVVPSVWHEPFGIVALEGIACGCVVVGSEEGGLKDAIGPCGATFPNGDVCALTDRLSRLLRDPSILPQYREAAPSHLQSHTRSSVADSYLKVLMAANAAPSA
jgi:glycosyltransferase involved in cell wall biosynthesis